MSGKGWFRKGGATREARKTFKHIVKQSRPTSSKHVIQNRKKQWSQIVQQHIKYRQQKRSNIVKHMFNNHQLQIVNKSGQTTHAHMVHIEGGPTREACKTPQTNRQKGVQTSSNKVVNRLKNDKKSSNIVVKHRQQMLSNIVKRND
jgi:hypothetical protein